MLDLTDEFRVSVAMILGMIAVLATLLVWRERDIPQTIQQLKILYQFKRTGLASASIERSMRRLIVGVALFSVGFGLCVVFFIYCFHYLTVIGLLIGKSGALDLGLFERLKDHAEGVRNDAVNIGTIAIFTLLGDWILAIFSRSQHIQIDVKAIPKESHPYTVLSDWWAAPAALWEQRIDHAANWVGGAPNLRNDLQAILRSGAWRRDWASWAKCAGAYQLSVSERSRDKQLAESWEEFAKRTTGGNLLEQENKLGDTHLEENVESERSELSQRPTSEKEAISGRKLRVLSCFVLGIVLIGLCATDSKQAKKEPVSK
jgi:hypothetical protein